MAVDWSHLPPELVDLIATKINFLDDFIRFRAVCTDWRASTPKTPAHLPPQLPWLMLPATRPDDSHTRASFFSLSNNKPHSLPLPSTTPSRRCGSSHGWLAIVDETPSFYLVNPLLESQKQSSSVVSLPPLTSFPNVMDFDGADVGREYSMNSSDAGEAYRCSVKEMRDSFIKKVILSTPRLNELNYLVLAIVNLTGDLAYCKRGDASWKFIDGAQGYCEDAVCVDGVFYAVNKFGGIVACDVNADSSPRASFINTPLLVGGDRQYLVACRGELLLVTRYLELEFDGESQQLDIIYRTTEFQVFRLDWKGLKWEVVTSLDDWAVFLGENSSFALLASDFPGCKGNRIYFTDDYSEWNYDGVNGDHDLGVYNLEDGSIEGFPCYPRNSYSGRSWPPPIWVTPNPC